MLRPYIVLLMHLSTVCSASAEAEQKRTTLRPLLISDPGGAALGGTNLGSRLGERALMDQQG
ncbi:MAG: hypothetical protein MUO38_13005, partial [Anaerolineales bacterium]|nr:hypothetical protein [Anaerolineales bacterium]